MRDQDSRLMAKAIALALSADKHRVRPNPRVGCLLVQNGEIIGEGFHQQLGGPHAEINALNACAAANITTQGATAYVTLEPCSHTGRTGPCVDALIKAQVAKVVYAMVDPNPAVAGGGLDKLRSAGIEVVGPCLEAEARALNPGFIRRMNTGLPWVMVKTAMSLDGKTAMASGESQWITGEQARLDVHRLRLAHSAVMTGIETVLQDDCQLTVRLPEMSAGHQCELSQEQQPIRVIMDTQARLPKQAKLWQSGAPIVWCMTEALVNTSEVNELQARYTQLTVLGLPVDAGGLAIEPLLRWLALERQCNEVMVEAGSRLSGAMMAQAWVNELVIYQAPVLLGHQARSAFTLPFDQLSDALRLNLVEHTVQGDDQRLRFLLNGFKES